MFSCKEKRDFKILSKWIELETTILIEVIQKVIQKDRPARSFIFVGSRFESLHMTTNPRVTKEM